MLTFSRTEYPTCAVLLLPDVDKQPVYRLLDFINAQLIRPDVAYCAAGNVNSGGKRDLLIESVQPPDAKHVRSSTFPIPADGAGGSAMG